MNNHSKVVTTLSKRHGFTIVELLIVIVVIGILAAITLVAFNGIQNRAKASAAQSASSQASKKLQTYFLTNADTYPTDLATAGITNSGDTTFQYSVNNTTNPKTYCITTTTSNTSYYQNNTTQPTPTSGGCPGHGVGGVAAITNLVKNPRGVSGGSGWFGPLGTTTDTLNISYASRTDWHRFTAAASGNKIMRLYIDLAELENGTAYTASALVANDTASSVYFSLDFSDINTTGYTLAPGEVRRVYVTGTRSTYDATFRFIDIDSITSSTSILITDVMLTRGTSQYNFGYGGFSSWVWNGTVNASTSTGPPL